MIAKVKGTYIERTAQGKIGAEVTDSKKQKRKAGKDQSKGNPPPIQPGLLPGIAPGAVVQNMVPSAIAPPSAGKLFLLSSCIIYFIGRKTVI